MKFSACDAPSIALRRASRMGFLAHLSVRERQVWDAFRGEDGTCYLRFAPEGGPVVWMRQEEEGLMRAAGGEGVVAAIAPRVAARAPARKPQGRVRTLLVGRYGSRQLLVFAGTRTR